RYTACRLPLARVRHGLTTHAADPPKTATADTQSRWASGLGESCTIHLDDRSRWPMEDKGMTIARILLISAVGVWLTGGSFVQGFVSNRVGVITTFSAPAVPREQLRLGSNKPELLAQGLCKTFIGEYISHDHAIQVQNSIRRKGFHAWIENHGCLTCTVNTRTYVVFAMLRCR
ncbi:MAG: hypothetical protein ACREBC_32160, partial [Pyrinomonadaceae bacterium]